MLMMNPASYRLDKVSTDYKKIEWSDVSAALGMGSLDEFSYHLGRLIFCDDTTSKKIIITLSIQHLINISKKNNWRTNIKIFTRLSELACFEIVYSTPCKYCHDQPINIAECSNCHGSGYIGLKNCSKYKYASIEKRNWNRRWKKRYEELYKKFLESEQKLNSHIQYHFMT